MAGSDVGGNEELTSSDVSAHQRGRCNVDLALACKEVAAAGPDEPRPRKRRCGGQEERWREEEEPAAGRLPEVCLVSCVLKHARCQPASHADGKLPATSVRMECRSERASPLEPHARDT